MFNNFQCVHRHILFSKICSLVFYSFCYCCKCNCFLNFIFRSLLLVYKNAIYFCTLILYPEILLKSFISYNRFSLAILKFLYTREFHLQIILLIFLSLLFLVQLLWLRHLGQCFIEVARIGIFVLFLILGRVFGLPSVSMFLSGFRKWPLLG